MDRIHRYESPLGWITLAGEGDALTGLWFDGQEHFAGTLSREHAEGFLPVFREAERWLDLYFTGQDPGFRPKLMLPRLKPKLPLRLLLKLRPKLQKRQKLIASPSAR